MDIDVADVTDTKVIKVAGEYRKDLTQI